MSRSGLSFSRPREAANETARDARASSRQHVLLVEDDAALRSSLAEVLEAEGFDVATAPNGRAALEVLRTGPPPSAIVLDLMMPVMDGWDFRHAQLADPALKDIPVVVVTAAGFSSETIRAQFGDVRFVPKSVPVDQLREALDRVCARASLAAAG